MKYQHRVLGMPSLLAVITDVDRVCIAVAAVPGAALSMAATIVTPSKSPVSSITFGYIVGYSGDYDAPFPWS